jgi:hypothetical protein
LLPLRQLDEELPDSLVLPLGLSKEGLMVCKVGESGDAFLLSLFFL